MSDAETPEGVEALVGRDAPTGRVGLFACAGYDPVALDEVILGAADYAGFPDIAGKRILVKPNLLKAATPDKAVTTHPEFVAAVLRFLWKRGASRVMVGDSPGFQSGLSVGKPSGIHEAAMSGGAEWVDFAPGKPKAAPAARLVKSFALASVLDECDLVVNLPKLKTHRLMNYTGAIKNLFGLIPGLGKSRMHLRFADKEKFGTMLVDLAFSIPRCFSFMDGIVAMEGEGPGGGDPFPLGLVLASGDMAALDWTAAQCIGYDPRRLPYIVDAIERTGRASAAPEIQVGPRAVAEVAAKNFALLPYGGATAPDIVKMPGFAWRAIRRLLADRPIFLPEKCVGCLACVKICPAGALELGKNAKGQHQIRIDDQACITCFCCHEVCPAQAIAVGRVLARRPMEKKRS
ncbi:MAG TPA: DUF362 domain-containing protein [Rectinemataceae bacterium]|nr:DUF362 domain-containing protein [Rectinemataceae bacterium]